MTCVCELYNLRIGNPEKEYKVALHDMGWATDREKKLAAMFIIKRDIDFEIERMLFEGGE